MYSSFTVSHYSYHWKLLSKVDVTNSGQLKFRQIKGKIVPVHALRAYDGMNIQLHPFLSSALGSSKWSVSRLAHFTSEERASGTHRTEGLIRPRVKKSCSCKDFNHGVEHNCGKVHGIARVLQNYHNHSMCLVWQSMIQVTGLFILTAARVPIGHQPSPTRFSQHTPLVGTTVQFHMVYRLPKAYTVFGSLTVPRCLWCTTAAYTLATRNAESYP